MFAVLLIMELLKVHYNGEHSPEGYRKVLLTHTDEGLSLKFCVYVTSNFYFIQFEYISSVVTYSTRTFIVTPTQHHLYLELLNVLLL